MTGTVTSRYNFAGIGGNDTPAGASNIDMLNGGAGEDFLLGLASQDSLLGDAGDDTMTAAARWHHVDEWVISQLRQQLSNSRSTDEEIVELIVSAASESLIAVVFDHRAAL
jgi:Ca2+-binding RTX toxin-like protein